MESVIHFSTTESGGYMHQQLEIMNHDHGEFGCSLYGMIVHSLSKSKQSN